MSASTPMKIAIRNTLITWGVPILMASIPYITWIDEVACFMRMIGWRVVAIATSLHIFLTTFLFIKWIGIKKRLNEDYHQHLEPVPNNGYWIDKRNGEAVCPKCNANNTLTYMALNNGQYPYFKCTVCGTVVWKDGRKPPPKKYSYKDW